MEGLRERLQELEGRTRRMERQLLRWRLLACVITVGVIAYAAVLPGQAQFTQPTQASTFTTPFTIKGTDGVKVMEITDYIDKGNNNSHDALLTLYRNGQPAAIFRTTGKVYKDAYDPAESYLNVVETWLYRYPRGKDGAVQPTAYLASSVALTRAGGSIVVFNEQGAPSTTPPMGARLTAKRGVGGALMLFDPEGNEGKVVTAK